MRRLSRVLLVGVVLGVWGVTVYAQTLSERIYLPAMHFDPTSTSAPTATVMPTVTPTVPPEPTAVAVLPPWRRPDTSYVSLTIVDIEVIGTSTMRVTVRNDTGRTVIAPVLSRVTYYDDGSYASERAERYSGSIRIVPSELRALMLFGYRPPTPPSSRLEAFALPE